MRTTVVSLFCAALLAVVAAAAGVATNRDRGRADTHASVAPAPAPLKCAKYLPGKGAPCETYWADDNAQDELEMATGTSAAAAVQRPFAPALEH